ncbi:hypothetical protein BC835DRAFT_1030151 [Cytidiella melzeri]|nr:hypothetical protein BC835DRAFT_1030151 [Cytidiella melzeri]
MTRRFKLRFLSLCYWTTVFCRDAGQRLGKLPWPAASLDDLKGHHSSMLQACAYPGQHLLPSAAHIFGCLPRPQSPYSNSHTGKSLSRETGDYGAPKYVTTIDTRTHNCNRCSTLSQSSYLFAFSNDALSPWTAARTPCVPNRASVVPVVNPAPCCSVSASNPKISQVSGHREGRRILTVQRRRLRRLFRLLRRDKHVSSGCNTTCADDGSLAKDMWSAQPGLAES